MTLPANTQKGHANRDAPVCIQPFHDKQPKGPLARIRSLAWRSTYM